MTLSLPETADGSFDAEAFDVSELEGATVLALGPGIGSSAGNRKLVRKIVREALQPLVVDADGLNALAQVDDWQAASRLLVLTPHPGEMARLTGYRPPRFKVVESRWRENSRLAAAFMWCSKVIAR